MEAAEATCLRCPESQEYRRAPFGRADSVKQNKTILRGHL